MLKRVLDGVCLTGVLLFVVGILMVVFTQGEIRGIVQMLGIMMVATGIASLLFAGFIGRLTDTEGYEPTSELAPPLAIVLAAGALLHASLAAADPGILPPADPNAPAVDSVFSYVVFFGFLAFVVLISFFGRRIVDFLARLGRWETQSPTKLTD